MSHPRANHRPLVFPQPPRALPAAGADPARPPANLPAPLTPFIGRQAVQAALLALLQQDAIRLLTLTGPGGVGKTRLALQVGNALFSDYTDGVVFVDLAPVSDPALVLPALSSALGVSQSGRRLLADLLAEYLRDKRLLLVLDNFEHLLAAGPAVSALLAAAPGMQALVTSRVPLGCYGEQEFPVPLLALPAAATEWRAAALAEIEAVQLFVARARALQPSFSLTDENAAAVAAICRRLDGLPLALELAAARTRLFTPAALLARLERRLPLLTGGAANRPARQQTLRGALAWSYDLLEAMAQALFARLGVFAGGATLDAVAAVAAPLGLAPGVLLDTLESLVAQNLLTVRPGAGPAAGAADETRFVMLETIREYAGEQLAARGELATAQADHAAYFLALAERFAAAVRGPEQPAWLARLEAEHDNLRAALAWSLAGPDPWPAARLAGALWWFWYMRGHISEGRGWLDRVLALAPLEPPEHLARALLQVYNGAGVLAGIQCAYAQASHLTRHSLDLARRLDDQSSVSRALNNLGIIARRQGDYSLAAACFTECRSFCAELGDRPRLAAVLTNLALVRHIQGEYAHAWALAQESIDVRRAIGDQAGLALALENMARLVAEHGDGAAALALLDESEALAQEIGSALTITHTRNTRAWLLLEQGAAEQAAPLFEQSHHEATAIGEPDLISDALTGLGCVALVRQDYPQAHACLRAAITIQAQTQEYNADLATGLEWLAELELRQAEAGAGAEHAIRGATLLGAMAARRADMGAPEPPARRAHHAEVVQAARAQLPPAAFAAAWQAGQALTFAAAAALALADPPHRPPPGLVAPPPSASAPAARPAPARAGARDILDLTEREIAVLRLVATGLTNKEIAARLALSPRTVQAHLYRIFHKLDVTTRSAALRYAVDHGLV